MADETTTEVTEKSGEAVEATVHSGPADAERTEATDTRPPEQKEEKAAPAEPTESAAPATTATKTEKHTEKKDDSKAKRAAARRTPTPAAEEPKAAKPRAAKEWAYVPPSPSLCTRIQRGLGRHGFYYGPADGRFETKSVQGVQRAIKLVGFEGTPSGHIGEEQAKLIQTFAKKHGTYTGPINKKIDENTWAGFAVALERLP
jgi:hypothetical protein